MYLYDAIIIGAGPAGLSAAIYLARFRRKVLIIDAEKGRSMLPGTYHNIMGFAEPIERRELRRLGVEQALRYGAEKVCNEVNSIKLTKQETFEVFCRGISYFAKKIIFCAGVVDNWPQIDGYEEYLGYSIHSCPICAGYESIDKKLIAVGYDDRVSKFILEIINFTDKITIVTNGMTLSIQETYLNKVKRLNIPILTNKIIKLVGKDSKLEKVVLDNGKELEADIIYSTLGVKVNSALLQQFGVSVNDKGYIIVDRNQKTNVEGIYAAGDVTDFDHKQVVTSMYEGCTAAISVHSKLLRDEIEKI